MRTVLLLVMLLGGPTRVDCRDDRAVVGDRVWNDVNRNGIQDPGEPGINGITVSAYDALTHAVLDTHTTQGSGGLEGTFLLDCQGARSVYLKATLPPHFTFTAPKQGSNDRLDSDVEPITGRTQNIAFDDREPRRCQTHWDIGLVVKLFERGELGHAGPPPANSTNP